MIRPGTTPCRRGPRQAPALWTEAPSPPAPTRPSPETSVDSIREDPARYYGKAVTVTGEVDKVYTDRVFELEGSGWAFNDNITVVTKTPVRIADMPLAKGDHLILKGTVQKFVSADITRDYGWTASPDVLVRIEKRPVLVAESIRLVGEYGTWSAKTTPPPTGPITTTLIIVPPSSPRASWAAASTSVASAYRPPWEMASGWDRAR
ncbi:MAG: hypothetical protein R3F14_16855 [Polyangiaceae bacterium]